MNLSWISSILDLINKALDAFGRFKALFFSPSDSGAAQEIEEANKAARAAADISRQTEAQAEKDISDAESQGAHDSAAVDSAGGLRGERDAVEQAIERANKRPGADSIMRGR